MLASTKVLTVSPYLFCLSLTDSMYLILLLQTVLLASSKLWTITNMYMKPQSKMNRDNTVRNPHTVVNAHKQLLPCNDHSRTGLLKIREPQVLNNIILSILCIFHIFHWHILYFSLPFSTSCATLFLPWWRTPETWMMLQNLPLSWLLARGSLQKAICCIPTTVHTHNINMADLK